MARVLAFEAALAADSPVIRTIAIRNDQTLEQLHEALRLAFGWFDPHLYSFWVGSDPWDHAADEYTAPYDIEVGPNEEAKSTRDTEWRLVLEVVKTWAFDDESYPMLVDAQGTPPPQI